MSFLYSRFATICGTARPVMLLLESRQLGT
jgi:hypothetical protein